MMTAFIMFYTGHLPIVGQLRQAEGDRNCGDEDAVKDGQHCKQLAEAHLQIILIRRE